MEINHGSKQPSLWCFGLQGHSAVKTAKRLIGLVKAFELMEPKLGPCGEIFRMLLGLFAQEFAIKKTFFLTALVIHQLPEVVNEEIRGRKLHAQRTDLGFYQFVNSAAEVDVRVTPEQAAVLVCDE